MQAGGHSDSASSSSRGNLNFHMAEVLIDRFVRRARRREREREKEEESDGEGRGRSLSLIFVSGEERRVDEKS